MMFVVKDYPPNIAKIRERFGNIPDSVVFTYGDTIYNPSGVFISDPVDIHERTHKFQQGIDPEGWWNKYLEDDKFRLEQELLAHQFQYKRFCQLRKDRNARAKYLELLAKGIADPLYGSIISKAEARKLIKQ